MRWSLPIAALLMLAGTLVGCRTTRPDGEEQRLQQELGANVPLWVELECTGQGKPRFKEYSVLKLPSEAVGWALARLDDHCRVYGTLVPKGDKADLCDIRYRSKEPVVANNSCRCVAGRYDLEEGYPSSRHCCEKYPDKVYCREKPPASTEESPDLPDETRTGD